MLEDDLCNIVLVFVGVGWVRMGLWNKSRILEGGGLDGVLGFIS